METSNPSQGRLRGHTDSEMVVTGKDKFYVKAAEYGRLYVPYDASGHSISMRVARHLTGVKEIAAALNDLGEGPLTINGIPSYAELAADVGQYLAPPA